MINDIKDMAKSTRQSATVREEARQDAEELADIILVLHRCFLQNLSQELGKNTVSFPQFFLLGYLSQTPKLAMSGIAEKMGHTTAAATGLVDRLEKMGYVDRNHSDEDRRVVNVRITKKGTGLVQGIRDDMVKNLLSIFGELTHDDQKTWLKIYRRVLQRCEEKRAGK